MSSGGPFPVSNPGGCWQQQQVAGVGFPLPPPTTNFNLKLIEGATTGHFDFLQEFLGISCIWMHLYICVWFCVFVQVPRDQPRREGSWKLPVKAVGNDLFLVDIDKRANLWWGTPLFLKSWLSCTRQLEGRDCANMQCVFVALFGKDFIQLVLITGPAFDIKQVSPSLEIGWVSYKFIVEFWKIKSIPDKAQYKYFTLIGGDGKGGAVHDFITRFTFYGSTPVWTKCSIGRSCL